MSEATQPAAIRDTVVPTQIYLVSYPKVIFLYPTFLTSLICGAILSFHRVGNMDDRIAIMATSVFLGVLAVNLVVFSFDFPRTTSLTVFFLVAAMVMGVFLASHYYPDIFPVLGRVLSRMKPLANATFFHIFSGMLAIIYFMVMCNIHFDYWEVRPNELLHHHGFLSDLERYPAPNLRISKEINDVFEYVLLKSGRLILQPSNEPRSIILDNVLFIGRKEQQLTRMLSTLRVQVEGGNRPVEP